MKILLDHCVPRRFGAQLQGHDVHTAASLCWSDLKNGALLKSAGAAGFEVMVTVDQNLPYQQRASDLPLAVVVLICRSNELAELVKLIEPLQAALKTLEPGAIIRVG